MIYVWKKKCLASCSAVAASEVYSETQDMRFAYGGVEADSPAVTRT